MRKCACCSFSAKTCCGGLSTARNSPIARWSFRAPTSAARVLPILLAGNPPEAVKSKLVTWGVQDFASIFSRGMGLNMMFVAPPPFDILGAEFLSSYHRYADSLFRCYLESQPHRTITCDNFRFDLYASGEYSKMLETEWEGE